MAALLWRIAARCLKKVITLPRPVLEAAKSPIVQRIVPALSQDRSMATPPRRPTNPIAAAEAAFKPVKKPAAPIREAPAAPNVRELVSIRIDRAVLDHFQEDGPGWQDRINDALRQIVAGKSQV